MTPTIEDAIAFAAQRHRGQKDKAGKPYILHPLRVMLAMHTDEERRVAVLHDVMEDRGVTRRELDNMDLTRLENVTAADRARLAKYDRARERLLASVP